MFDVKRWRIRFLDLSPCEPSGGWLYFAYCQEAVRSVLPTGQYVACRRSSKLFLTGGTYGYSEISVSCEGSSD